MSTMQKKFCKARLIIGMTGTFVAVVIACTFGLIQQHWNYQMVRTVGSVSYLMENWRQCIQVEAPKMGMTIQVNLLSLSRCWSASLWYGYLTYKNIGFNLWAQFNLDNFQFSFAHLIIVLMVTAGKYSKLNLSWYNV